MSMRMVLTGLALWALAGCANEGSAGRVAHYRCEHDIEFSVRFIDDLALLDAGRRGYDVLYRQQGASATAAGVYANPRMRAEFGLGGSGREAVLRYPLLPLAARCARDD